MLILMLARGASAADAPTPQGWVPLPGAGAWAKGQSHGVVGGMRVERAATGETLPARERFADKTIASMPLPARLGGGWLFYSRGSDGRLWHGGTFAGALRAIGRGGSGIREVHVGADRLLLRMQNGRLVGLLPSEGAWQVVGGGRLPPSTGLDDVRFDSAWEGRAFVDLLGPMATVDGGTTWRAQDVPVVVGSAAAGELPDGLPDTALADALMFGGPAHAEAFWSLGDGALERWSSRTGALLERRAGGLRGERCTAAPVGDAQGYVCVLPSGQLRLYQQQGEEVSEVLSWQTPRWAHASGRGAVVVSGGCGDVSLRGHFCVVDSNLHLRPHAVTHLIASDTVVGMTDGSLWTLRLEDDATGVVARGDAGGKFWRKGFSLPDELGGDSWTLVHGWEQCGERCVEGWLEAAGSFVSLRISVEGERPITSIGELVRPVVRESGGMVRGPHGFVQVDTQAAKITADFGRSWKAVELPPDAATDNGPRGVSSHGVRWGEWFHRGFAPAPPTTPPEPSPLVLPVWRGPDAPLLHCATNAAVARRGVPLPGWTPWLGMRAPVLTKAEQGVTVERLNVPTPFRLYAWGPSVGSWEGPAKIRASILDPFRAVVFSGESELTGIADAASAGAGFGTDAGGGATWQVALDVAGRGALLTWCKQSTCMLFDLPDRQEQRLEHIEVEAQAWSQLYRPTAASAVRSRDGWAFVTHGADRALFLWRQRGGVVSLVKRYPRAKSAERDLPMRLAERVETGELGLVFGVRDVPGRPAPMLYVRPIDPDTHELGEAEPLLPQDLAGIAPERCGALDGGWRLELPLSVPRLFGVPASTDFRARVRLSRESGCVEAMTAESGLTDISKQPVGKPPELSAAFPLMMIEPKTLSHVAMSCQFVSTPGLDDASDSH